MAATQLDRARKWTNRAIAQVQAKPGTPIQSKDWGFGDRARCVTIRYDGERFHASLLAWGFPEREISGDLSTIFSEVVDCLSGAG